MPIKKFKPGDMLKNGYTIICLYGEKDWEINTASRTVLGFFSTPSETQYASWIMDPEGNTTIGTYFSTFFTAVDNLKNRVENQRQIN